MAPVSVLYHHTMLFELKRTFNFSKLFLPCECAWCQQFKLKTNVNRICNESDGGVLSDIFLSILKKKYTPNLLAHVEWINIVDCNIGYKSTHLNRFGVKYQIQFDFVFVAWLDSIVSTLAKERNGFWLLEFVIEIKMNSIAQKLILIFIAFHSRSPSIE